MRRSRKPPPEASETPVELRGLVKRYGELVAVDHVDLTVEAGDVYGYLGPNGAGKTTSLRMMLGLIVPTAGSVRPFGGDPPGGCSGATPRRASPRSRAWPASSRRRASTPTCPAAGTSSCWRPSTAATR